MSVHAGDDPGVWGPTLRGGQRLRRLRTFLLVLGSVVGLGAVALASTAFLLYQQAEANITRLPLSELQRRADPAAAQHFLVVGSDARGELTRAERNELSLGHDFGGAARSDTVILVSVLPDREGVSVVSFPRDLLVYDVDDGRSTPHKLADTFNEGANNLVQILRTNFGVPVNHYVEVSVQGFIEVVETIGAVEICLEEGLVDTKSGADFAAGCRRMTPVEALSYVRSRVGTDYRRIERQQTFIRAMIDEMLSARILTSLPRLSDIVRDVSGNVTTDPGLATSDMVTLAGELRSLAGGDIPMVTVPSYTQDIGQLNYVIAYEPGARALFEAIREGEPLASRGTSEQRQETAVALWSGGGPGSGTLVSTLGYADFDVAAAGHGPDAAAVGATTTVYELPGHSDEAAWTAAVLGAPVEPLPAGVEAPVDTDVVVAVGDDATYAG